jgi:hypothetical protein
LRVKWNKHSELSVKDPEGHPFYPRCKVCAVCCPEEYAKILCFECGEVEGKCVCDDGDSDWEEESE